MLPLAKPLLRATPRVLLCHVAISCLTAEAPIKWCTLVVLDEGAYAGDGLADDQILHLIRALVGIECLGIGEEARDIVIGDDPVAAQQLAAPRNSFT